MNTFVLNPHYDKKNPEKRIFDDTMILYNDYKQYNNIYKKGIAKYEHLPKQNPDPISHRVLPPVIKQKINNAHNKESKIIHSSPKLYDFCHPREISINRFEILHRDIQNPKHVIYPLHRFGAPTHMIGRTKYTRTI